MDISKIRKDYSQKTLDVKDVQANPMEQFGFWLDDAIRAEVLEPTAMVLSTVHLNIPSSRVVLLKGLEEGGFVFFTNYQSRKGMEMLENENVALNFFWAELERQVRVVGRVKTSSAALSDTYFQSRPAHSRVGAWTSPQSKGIPSREWLEDQELSYRKKFEDQEIPRPEYWGGYVVVPQQVEFWQGRPNRLHDRIQYTLQDGSWNIERLAP